MSTYCILTFSPSIFFVKLLRQTKILPIAIFIQGKKMFFKQALFYKKDRCFGKKMFMKYREIYVTNTY